VGLDRGRAASGRTAVSEKALATLPDIALSKRETPADRLQARYDKLQEKDIAIVEAMDRFAELPMEQEEVERDKMRLLLVNGTLEELRAAGWKNKKQLRSAIYATMPKKDWPAAMQAAHERVMARVRKQGKSKAGNVFNLNMISIPAPVPQNAQDVIIEVEAKEHEK